MLRQSLLSAHCVGYKGGEDRNDREYLDNLEEISKHTVVPFSLVQRGVVQVRG